MPRRRRPPQAPVPADDEAPVVEAPPRARRRRNAIPLDMSAPPRHAFPQALDSGGPFDQMPSEVTRTGNSWVADDLLTASSSQCVDALIRQRRIADTNILSGMSVTTPLGDTYGISDIAMQSVRHATELGVAQRAVIESMSVPRRLMETPVPSNSEHARFSPSAASRWLACPRSIVMTELHQQTVGYMPPPDGEAANRGRAMHEVAENDLRSQLGEAYGGSVPELSNVESDLVTTYTRYVMELVHEIEYLTGEQPTTVLERRMRTHLTECWGTCDAIIVSPITKELWVIDLKTGRQTVQPYRNPQLMIYALGYISGREGSLRNIRDDWKYHFVIVQPTDEDLPIKLWTAGSADLIAFYVRMTQAVMAADIASTPLVPGDHCTYCPAAASCPALRDRSLSVFDPDPANASLIVRDTVQVEPFEVATTVPLTLLSPEQRAFFLTNRDTIRDFLDAVQASAIQNPPPGFKVVEGRTRRRWRDPAALVEHLRSTAPELIRETAPTLAEAERVLGRRHSIIEDGVIAPPGAPSVVPVSDPRPAITPGAQVFLAEILADRSNED